MKKLILTLIIIFGVFGHANAEVIMNSSSGGGSLATYDADSNGVVDSAEGLESGSTIEATQIHDGGMTNTEFGYLSGVTGNIQDQVDTINGVVSGVTDQIQAQLNSAHTYIEQLDSDLDGDIDNIDSGASTYKAASINNGDATLTIGGQYYVKEHEDGVAYHLGDTGEISGEVFDSKLEMLSISLDPGAWYDSDAEVFLIPVDAKKFPNGFIIDFWEITCNCDPDVEIEATLSYADDYISLGSGVTIDVLNTTNGTASEDTDANINGGSAIPVDKFTYIWFSADPEGTCTQMHFYMLYHAEED